MHPCQFQPLASLCLPPWVRLPLPSSLLGPDIAAIAQVTRTAPFNTGRSPSSSLSISTRSPPPRDTVVRMANGARVQTDGKIKLVISLKDAQGNWTPAQEHNFEVLPESPVPMILGKPWKMSIGAMHFYEMDVVLFPTIGLHTLVWKWTTLISNKIDPLPTAMPKTPLEAVELLATAQPQHSHSTATGRHNGSRGACYLCSSGKDDGLSEERAETAAQLLEKQFGTQGMQAEPSCCL